MSGARKPQQERRIYELKNVELRQANGEPAQIVGYAAVFNSRSVDLGGFVEEIAPGAFRRTLAAGPDVRATIDHKGGLTTLGRTKNGTLKLAEDRRGLRVAITPPDTQAGRDVVALVNRQDLDQMSFMFRVPKGGDDWKKTKDGTPLRILRELDINDGDVAIVTYPAYPETTVEARDRAAVLANEPTPPDVDVNAWMTAGQRDRWQGACYHEAAHIVMAERLQPDSAVKIEMRKSPAEDLDSSAHHWLENGTEEQALVSIAGVVAERILQSNRKQQRIDEMLAGKRRTSKRTWQPRLSPSDKLGVTAYFRANYIGGPNQSGAYDQLHAAAREKVIEHWPEIENVARELIERGQRSDSFTMGTAEILDAMKRGKNNA